MSQKSNSAAFPNRNLFRIPTKIPQPSVSFFLQILGLQPRISKVFSIIRITFTHSRSEQLCLAFCCSVNEYFCRSHKDSAIASHLSKNDLGIYTK